MGEVLLQAEPRSRDLHAEEPPLITRTSTREFDTNKAAGSLTHVRRRMDAVSEGAGENEGSGHNMHEHRIANACARRLRAARGSVDETVPTHGLTET